MSVGPDVKKEKPEKTKQDSLDCIIHALVGSKTGDHPNPSLVCDQFRMVDKPRNPHGVRIAPALTCQSDQYKIDTVDRQPNYKTNSPSLFQ